MFSTLNSSIHNFVLDSNHSSYEQVDEWKSEGNSEIGDVLETHQIYTEVSSWLYLGPNLKPNRGGRSMNGNLFVMNVRNFNTRNIVDRLVSF